MIETILDFVARYCSAAVWATWLPIWLRMCSYVCCQLSTLLEQ